VELFKRENAQHDGVTENLPGGHWGGMHVPLYIDRNWQRNVERLCIKKKKETLLVNGVDGWVENKNGLTTHVVLFFRV